MINKNNNIIIAPSSKSVLQRVLFLSLLSETKIKLKNVTWCDDTIAVKKILLNLNVSITEQKNTLIINSTGFKIDKNNFNVGESGLAVRIFSVFFALFDKKITLTGEGTLKKRNLSQIKEVLSDLSVKVKDNNGYLPLEINGKIIPKDIEIENLESSQILSGLLMVLPKSDKQIIIKVKNLQSKPYIDLSIKILKNFGIDIKNIDYKKFIIPANQKYISPKKYNIEGDWSGAAFFCVLGAVYKQITIDNLDINSNQADKKIINVLELAGANVVVNTNKIKISPNKLSAFDFDASDSPDLFPPLVCLAVFCNGTSTIKGVKRLFNKESNRATVLQNELKKININIKINDDYMFVGKSNIKQGEINSYNDHRIVMTAAILSVMANKKISIKNKECVNKSYPEFFNDLYKIRDFKV